MNRWAIFGRPRGR